MIDRRPVAPDPEADPSRILILRALQLGDMLCSVPALRALRARFPHARITLIGLSWARAFVRRFSGYLDGFLPFPGFPGLPGQISHGRGYCAFVRSAIALRSDLAVQMHGDGSLTNRIVASLGARRTVGFRRKERKGVPGVDTIPWPESGPEIRRWIALAAVLGAPSRGEHLEWPVTSEDMAALRRCDGVKSLRAGRFAVVHPGARATARRWLPERFAAVADHLSREGLDVVLTGSREEMPLTQAVARHMTRPALDLAGRIELDGMGALFTDARLLVSNDTGVSHMAAALGVPSVVIYGASDPDRWAPLDRLRHRRVLPPAGVPECSHPTCDPGSPCILSISPEVVWRETRDLLESA
jgi:ADP-heptose:LPS heptosyltransferase